MKKFIKIMSIIISVMMLSTLFVSCSNKNLIKIGIIQFAPHPSLDNCYKGIIEGLKEQGFVDGDKVEIDYQNAQGDMPTSDQIAKNMVSKNYDIIFAIATPSAISAYSVASKEDIPTVFCAVSDPVSAKLVKSLEVPGFNSTGTSDVLNFDKQFELIRAMQPEAKKIGVLYTTSEPNSVSQLETFKALAPTYGFEVISQGVTNASEIPQAATTLCSKVDCVNNFTDNNVVTNLSVLLQKAKDNKIPVYGSEVAQVENGCIASESIDYVSLGKKTGIMGAKILNGSDASKMAVLQIKDTAPVYNSTVLSFYGITLPDAYKNAKDVK